MRVPTTTECGPVATMNPDQIQTEFSHIMWTNFSGLDKIEIFSVHSLRGEEGQARRHASCQVHEAAICGGGPDRKSVVSGTSVSVRVDPGGRRTINKKKQKKTQDAEKIE